MKVLLEYLFVSVAVVMASGCASDVVYIPKIPPYAQAKLLDYDEKPGEKAFIIAVDPCGDYAFGYAYGKSTLKEAARVAAIKCDANRVANRVAAKPCLYALNDTVVYEEMMRKIASAELKTKQAESE